MASFKCSPVIAKSQLDNLASQFEEMALQASNATVGKIANLRADYERLLQRANYEVRQCVGNQDADRFVSGTRLMLGAESSRAEERKAVETSARNGRCILSEWVEQIQQMQHS